jgi:hypothetical protein
MIFHHLEGHHTHNTSHHWNQQIPRIEPGERESRTDDIHKYSEQCNANKEDDNRVDNA